MDHVHPCGHRAGDGGQETKGAANGMKRVREELQRLQPSTLAQNAGWMVMGQGAGFVLQAGYFVLLARLLGSTEYGIYAGTFALVSIASQYSALGSGTVFL